MSQPQPRIAPLRAPFEPPIAELLEKWMGPGSEVEPLALFRTLAVHPQLAARMRPVGAGILAHGTLAPREREIVIHRTCARTGAEYEWGVHVLAFGRPLGLSEEQIAATVHGTPTDPAFSERDGLLVAMVDELHERSTVSQQLWASLAGHFDEQQLLELLIVAGWYRLLSYVINAAAIELEPWAERLPAPPTR
jgi:4-carboxymuconolactone decarboxylase